MKSFRTATALLLFALALVASAAAAEQSTRGACCTTRSGRHCVDSQTADSCSAALDGVFLGTDSLCSGNQCKGMTGACCAKDGSCNDSVAASACTADVGEFAGFGKRCDDAAVMCAAAAGATAVAPLKTDDTDAMHIMGHVRERRTLKAVAGATVVVMNRQRVRVAEAHTNAKGAFRILVPAAEATKKHTPFEVLVSEKNLKNADGERCARSGASSALTLHEITAAHKKFFERNIEVDCGRFGGKSKAHSDSDSDSDSYSDAATVTPVIHKVVAGSLLNVRGVHDASADSSDSFSDSDSDASEQSRDNALHNRHPHSDFDDDDATSSDSDSHHGGHGHGFHHGHDHHSGSTWWWFWAILIGLLILCCVGVCVWSLFYNDPQYMTTESRAPMNRFAGAMRARNAAVKY